MKVNLVPAFASERSVDLPPAGPMVVIRGHGWIHARLQTFAGYELGRPPNWLPDEARDWLPLYERAAAYVARRRGAEPRVYVAPNESLVNYSVFRLRAYQSGHRASFVHDFAPRDDSVSAYRELLRRERPDALLTTSRPGPEFGAPITPRFVEQAARSLGFRLSRRLAMPDGRELRIWERTS